MMYRLGLRLAGVLTTGWTASLLVASAGASAAPLHEEIDRLINAASRAPAADRTTDAEFVRRIYLDLAGRIPTASEAREFLRDAAPDKRQVLIDRLLNGPDYPRRMADAFHVMLMERRGEHPEWMRFLRNSFAENRPLNEVVRAILTPSADDETARGAAYFFTRRLEKIGQNPTDYPGLTRDIGRLFLGMDLQCAQCHDHLSVGDYKQSDFQGLFAFVKHTSIRTDVAFPAIGEGLMKQRLSFASVFEQKPMSTGPRLPGDVEVEIPTYKLGDEYLQPPDNQTKFPGVPKFSPLTVLSERLPTSENIRFTRNIANRLWFLMMGRGLVHPLDMHHSDNPASRPELLDLLATEFSSRNFDVKWFLRELALTETYQRSTILPEGVEPGDVPLDSFRVALERPLSAEQLLWGILVATGEFERIMADRGSTEELAEQEPLKNYLVQFAATFGNPPGEPEDAFTPSLEEALFLLNDRTVLEWLSPQPERLIHRLIPLSSPSDVAEELYLSVLTRFPTEEEQAELREHLTICGGNRAATLRPLIWALLASTEFRLNR